MPAKPHPTRCPLCRKIRAAHKAGITGRNEIAKKVGCALATVTAHAKHCGITFDRSATKVAVAARQVDLRAARQEILADLYDVAREDIRLLKASDYTYRVLFKDFSDTVTDAHAPSADRRNHVQTIAVAMNTAVKLEQVDASSNTGEVHSVLDTLAAGFAQAAAGYTPTADDLDP